MITKSTTTQRTRPIDQIKPDKIQYPDEKITTLASEKKADDKYRVHPGRLVKMELTPYQKMLYNEWLLTPDSGRYNLVFDQYMEGYVDAERLNQSCIRLVNDHLLVNSNIIEEDNRLYWVGRQLLAPDADLVNFYDDVLDDAQMLALVSKPFDLRRDRLVRFNLLRLGVEKYRLVYVFHHILVDALSFRQLVKEGQDHYNNYDHPVRVALAEQVELHHRLSATFDEILQARPVMNEFWATYLRGLQGTDLKFLHKGGYTPTKVAVPGLKNVVSEYRFSFDAVTLSQVRQLARKYRLTPYIYGQMVFGMLLHRMTGQQHIGISYPVAIQEGRDLIYGAHINSVVIGYRFDADTTVQQLINDTVAYFNDLKTSKGKYLPVSEMLQHAENSSMLDVSFIQTDLKDFPMRFEGLTKIELNDEWNIDLPNKLLFEQEVGEEYINYRVRFNNEELDGVLVSNFITIYKQLFGEVLADLLDDNTERRVSEYELLSEKEYRKLAHDRNATAAPYPMNKTIHGLFEAQVMRTPGAIALVCGEKKMTYAALNERANRLAHYLRENYDIQPDDRVGICLDRNEHMLVAILAVLKAGGAYVPIEPTYPADRIRFMVEDTQVRVLLSTETQQGSIGEVARVGIPVEYIDSSATLLQLATYSDTDLVTKVASQHLFYIVYTSGTTGRPKGVMIEHGHVVAVVDAITEAYNFSGVSKVTAFTSFGFDVSSSEFFVTLLNGHELHLLSEQVRTDVEALGEYLLTNEIEYAYLPPVVLANLPRVDYPALRTIIYAGEPCDQETAVYWGSRKRLYNYYGPTETNIATGKHITNGNVHLIGKPIANATVYVLDAQMGLLPVGVVGELYIGGAAVARGYLGLPELTNGRFIANPFQTRQENEVGANGRLYKTGDLVRYLPEGDLEYIGRNDLQVKIRGYRVEPGEVETQLTTYPGIRQAVVVVIAHEAGNKGLAGYYVANNAINEQALQAHLLQRLPEYMVPTAYVHMHQLPMTVNGKIDKTALPIPELKSNDAGCGAMNDMQAQLVAIYADVLGVAGSEIGIDDDFYKLGGNSILTVKLANKLRKTIGVTVSVANIFRCKTIRRLSEQLMSGSLGAVRLDMSVAVSGSQHILSFAQERLWFIGSYEGESAAYNMPGAFRLNIGTSVDSMGNAFRKIVQRHEVLRSLVITTADGMGRQVVLNENDLTLNIETVELETRAKLDDAIIRSYRHLFLLDRELPIRITFFKVRGEGQMYMSFNAHHIAFDGWSTEVMIRELIAFYNYFECLRLSDTVAAAGHLPAPLGLQYKEYAVWQRNYLSGRVLEDQLAYWKQQLADYEPLRLPLDRPRPAAVSYEGATVAFELDEELSDKLRAIARELEVSLYSLMLSGFYLVLSCYADQDDIVVGSPVANRHFGELMDTIGFFVNSLAMRQVIDRAQTLEDLVKTVGNNVIEAQLHQDLPFEKLVTEMGVPQDNSRHPIFQVMFTLHSFDNRDEMAHLMEPYEVTGFTGAKFDLVAAVNDRGSVLEGRFDYAVSIFDEATIRGYISTYKEVLKQLACLKESKGIRVREVNYMAKAEYNKVVYDWNDVWTPYPAHKTIHELIEDQVARTPGEVALVYNDKQLTYTQLNARANQLALYLRDVYALGPNELVGLCLERTEYMVIAILAVLKAGGAFVPVSPSLPAERMNYVLKDAGVRVLLTDSSHEEALSMHIEHRSLAIDDASFACLLDAYPKCNPTSAAGPGTLAYMIYTSGTTGEPKGVMIEHRGLVNMSSWMAGLVRPQDKFSCYINYTFDSMMIELFPSLISGCTLHLIDDPMRSDIAAYHSYIVEHGLTVLILPSVAATELSRHPLDKTSVRIMMTGGEVFSGRRYPGIAYYNSYGPTEASVMTTAQLYSLGCSSTNIGRPLHNNTHYILDADRRPLPVGAIGELYIGGDGVGRGYLNRPELTAERFIPNLFQTSEDREMGRNDRLYKTGDLVRYLHDGAIDYIGRSDFQVKIRGFRIELGEIEACIGQYPGIRQVVVVAREHAGGDTKYLVGYYVSEGPIDERSLSAYVSTRLPQYMLPAAYVHLTVLPVTANGKLDRRALPAPGFTSADTYIAPGNATQVQLCDIFADVLGLEAAKVGINDDFFRLGGNSILSVRLLNKIAAAFPARLSLAEVFTAKTVANIANRIEQDMNKRELIVQLNDSTAAKKMFMVHPGNAGCEAYMQLAEQLNGYYSCYGVDSYNLYHTDMITQLHDVAELYLEHILAVQPAEEGASFTFLGWSMGGQISMEIATILEQRGIENITIYLLDTLLTDVAISEIRTDVADEEMDQVIEIVGNKGVHGDNYRAFYETEGKLAEQPLSGRLEHTRVLLFKALRVDKRLTGRKANMLERYVHKCSGNNIERSLVLPERQMKVIPIPDQSHWTILASGDKIAADIIAGQW